MPKIGTQSFHHENKAGEVMKFEAELSVNSSGVFSIRIPDELEDTCQLLRLDIDRPQKNLYVRGCDLELAKKQVRQAIETYMQTERVAERVIVYSTDLKVSFWQNPDGSVASNGYMGVRREGGGEWGSIGGLHATNNVPHFRVGLAARVFDRVEYRRGAAGTKVVYEGVNTGHFDWVEGMEWAHRLNSFTGLSVQASDHMARMPYTEEAAKFFHDSLCGLCVMARTIDSFFKSPDALRLAIEAQTPLLAAPAPTMQEAVQS